MGKNIIVGQHEQYGLMVTLRIVTQKQSALTESPGKEAGARTVHTNDNHGHHSWALKSYFIRIHVN